VKLVTEIDTDAHCQLKICVIMIKVKKKTVDGEDLGKKVGGEYRVHKTKVMRSWL